MPKNSSVDVLRRWQAMDQMLAHDVLFVSEFAREWAVSTKTVRRDLDAFGALGQRIGHGSVWLVVRDGQLQHVWPFPAVRERGERCWTYESDQRPMFTATEDAPPDCSEHSPPPRSDE